MDDQLVDVKLPVDDEEEPVLNELPPNDPLDPPNPPKELVDPPNPELLENVEPPEPPPAPGPAPGPELGPDGPVVCVPVECEVLMLQLEGATQMQWSFWHSPHSRLFIQCIMHCCA